MKHSIANFAFTLVELIVVVTILAILSTIGFVSYSGYLTGVRDTNRISSLTALSDGLELYRTKNDLPLPDDSVEVKVNGTTIARQGYVGKNVLQTIEYSKAGKDPKDDSYYSYYLTDDNKYYQLMAFLEESDQLEVNNSGPLSHLKERGQGELRSKRGYSGVFKREVVQAATNYSNRYPKVYGKRLGILTDTDNTPIQEVSSIVTNGELDILNTGMTDNYVAHMIDGETYTGTGKAIIAGVLSKIIGNKYKSCKEILDANPNVAEADEYYDIQLGGSSFKVYCDMTSDGGGWTPIFNSGKQSEFWESGDDLTPNFTGNNCDPWKNNCISKAYNHLKLGSDVMIDGAQSNIIGDANTTRAIVNDIQDGIGLTLYDILNQENNAEDCKYRLGATDINVKLDSLIVSGDLYSLMNNGSIWCMNDTGEGESEGKVFILGKAGGNAAGWPSRVYGLHAHTNYRLWTR